MAVGDVIDGLDLDLILHFGDEEFTKFLYAFVFSILFEFTLNLQSISLKGARRWLLLAAIFSGDKYIAEVDIMISSDLDNFSNMVSTVQCPTCHDIIHCFL